MADISTVSARNKLKKTTSAGATRTAPYWMRLRQGTYLGFRVTSGTWVARWRNRDNDQEYLALKTASGYRPSNQFDEAKRMAEEWFAQVGSSAVRSAVRGTVKDALETYIRELAKGGRQATADNAEERFTLLVWADPIADLGLESGFHSGAVVVGRRALPIHGQPCICLPIVVLQDRSDATEIDRLKSQFKSSQRPDMMLAGCL